MSLPHADMPLQLRVTNLLQKIATDHPDLTITASGVARTLHVDPQLASEVLLDSAKDKLLNVRTIYRCVTCATMNYNGAPDDDTEAFCARCDENTEHRRYLIFSIAPALRTIAEESFPKDQAGPDPATIDYDPDDVSRVDNADVTSLSDRQLMERIASDIRRGADSSERVEENTQAVSDSTAQISHHTAETARWMKIFALDTTPKKAFWATIVFGVIAALGIWLAHWDALHPASPDASKPSAVPTTHAKTSQTKNTASHGPKIPR